MRSMEKEKDFIAQKSMAKSIGMNTLSKLKESLFQCFRLRLSCLFLP